MRIKPSTKMVVTYELHHRQDLPGLPLPLSYMLYYGYGNH